MARSVLVEEESDRLTERNQKSSLLGFSSSSTPFEMEFEVIRLVLMVLETMDVLVIDSDSEIYSEISDSEDLDESESTYGGHAQIILSSLDESIDKIDDFLTFERGFVHGDVVCYITDPSGQLGRVVDVDMVVELETISGGLIKEINSKRLNRFRSFDIGDYVAHGPWIGRVEKVFDMVTVLFDGGEKNEILVRDSVDLVPLSPRLEDSPFQYYPGQRVKVKIPHDSKLPLWLCGFKENQEEGTVFQVEVGLMCVNWICSVIIGQNFLSSTPARFQSPNDLTLLSYFLHANWQIGDWCKLPFDYTQNLQESAEAKQPLQIAPIYSMEMQKKIEMRSQEIYLITKTKRKVDILWQNGEKSVGIDPQMLSPVNNICDHDFWPEQFVMEKLTPEDVCAPRIQRFGIVKSVDSYERTVKVEWIVPEVKQTVDCICGSTEEMVSSYELIEHPDFSYCIGDIVVRYISHVEMVSENLRDIQCKDLVARQSNYPGNNSLACEETLGQHTDDSHRDFFQSCLSCIGTVIGYKDGCVEVRWASGYVSKVPPYEIFGLDKISSPAMLSSNEESSSSTISKGTADQQKLLSNKTEMIFENEDCATKSLKSVKCLFPGAAVGFLTHAARNFFGFSGSDSQGVSVEFCYFSKYEFQMEVLAQEAGPSEQNDELSIFPGEVRPMDFNKFDMVNDFSDHHFINGIGNGSMLSQAKRGWCKKVQQEWNILKKDLPDTIFVRVYEERMDLLRAVIVGAPGTPYHDGLFFFDIFFPPDYPHDPPAVHYKSCGLRLNPNLYESGKVCLSLLNTWTGTGSEVWNPENSTILQVLLSLQALVLNEKPYFNEAGYDEEIGKVGAEKNSITYNENAFLQSCKSMLYTLRRPPKHFKAFVEEHFAKRSHQILIACKAYLEGAEVGHAFDRETVSDEGRGSCSTGFKIMLAKLLPELISAFGEMGTDCTPFLNQGND
ncbi:hypothetical protein ZIOFF_002047 [Zingiber officinale]|uniref:E2 ubiquitin-conjugating enzyme n=1 Tax=Zingiber officinale TaxID=94328 RepID=A0A8J5LSM4_ZINOF|nr:hypothetical protein ZIOFF_002047 [Zingiber officinale]